MRLKFFGPALFGFIAIFLSLTAIAEAAPTTEIEPNDNIFQATGPINSEGAQGSLASTDDVDYFKVRLRPQRQVRFIYESNDCGWNVDFEVNELSGSSIASNDTSTSTYDTLTTPGIVGSSSVDAWLKVYGAGSGCTYRFKVTNTSGGQTDAIDPSPGAMYPMQPTQEPNDLPSQASGPLNGGVLYTGAIDTDNDVDWLFAPLRAGYTVTYTLAAANGSVGAQLHNNADDSSISSVYSRESETQSQSALIPFSSNYLLRIDGSTGASWRLLIAPAEAIGAPAPTARIAKRKLRRGRSIRIIVSNSSSTSLTYKLKRGKKTVRNGRRSIVSGVATISTRKLRRGNYRLTYQIPGIGLRTARIKLV